MNVILRDASKATAFTTLFQNAKVITRDFVLTFEKDFLYAQGMNGSLTTLFELRIPAEWFDVYRFEDATRSQPFVLGINTVLFAAMIATRNPAQSLHLQYDGDVMVDKLLIHFLNEDKEGLAAAATTATATAAAREVFETHFEFPLMEIEAEMMSIPEVSYPGEFYVKSATMMSLVNSLTLMGSDASFRCTEEEIQLSSQSMEKGAVTIVVPGSDLSLYMLEEGANLCLSFALKYLASVFAFAKMSPKVAIELHPSMPMKVTYYLDDTLDMLESMYGEEGNDEASREGDMTPLEAVKAQGARFVIYLAPNTPEEEQT